MPLFGSRTQQRDVETDGKKAANVVPKRRKRRADNWYTRTTKKSASTSRARHVCQSAFALLLFSVISAIVGRCMLNAIWTSQTISYCAYTDCYHLRLQSATLTLSRSSKRNVRRQYQGQSTLDCLCRRQYGHQRVQERSNLRMELRPKLSSVKPERRQTSPGYTLATR